MNPHELRRSREDAKLSQLALARLAKVPLITLAAFESGSRVMIPCNLTVRLKAILDRYRPAR